MRLYLFDRALKVSPRNADLFADKGKVLSELGQHHDALACYRRAVSINPKHEIALFNHGCSLLAVDLPADALAQFDRLIALAPNHPPAYHGRAIALTDLRRYDDAIESAEQALKLNPDFAEALQARGMTHTAMRRHDLALADFKKAAAPQPRPGKSSEANLVWRRCSAATGIRSRRTNPIFEAAVRAGRSVAPFTFLAVSDLPQEQLVCARSYAAKKYPVGDAAVLERRAIQA